MISTWCLCTISIRVLRGLDGSSQIAAQIQASEKNLDFFFYLKEISKFKDSQSLILETRKLRSREMNDLPEVA